MTRDWDISKQSKLIESCIMRIPLPVIYVAESPDGRIMIVDGLQRLSTFRRFLDGEFRLTKLGDNHPLEGMSFEALPIHLQERVEDTQLTLHILDRSAPDRARLDIFERVNSGEPLTRQQMRNAIYNGPGTRWLSRMAAHSDFQRVTGRSLNAKEIESLRQRRAAAVEARAAAICLQDWHLQNGNGQARPEVALFSEQDLVGMSIEQALHAIASSDQHGVLDTSAALPVLLRTKHLSEPTRTR